MPTLTDSAISFETVLAELGYDESPFYRVGTDDAEGYALPHILRDASRAGVRGTYFIRTMDARGGIRETPVVHVARAESVDRAREIHHALWNQGATPFVVVSLRDQVRVYTSFAYDVHDESVGQLASAHSLSDISRNLGFLRAEAIDSGSVWKDQAKRLRRENRVDKALLRALVELSDALVKNHGLALEVAHALVGRFVYLYYLHDRGVLSGQWLESIDIVPEDVFSAHVTRDAFRRLTNAVDERFNGHIFPIDWKAPGAPSAAAISAAARAFAGEDVATQQQPLFRTFNFSFIPIELLSAIYEKFLHDTGKAADQGAFYTSEPLADYVLAELNSVRALSPGMRVLDPCCGSGIFLVLAFRRLVEQELRNSPSGKLAPKDLRRILTSSIFGVERNRDASIVAEFSLVLTLLSYINPPELHRPPNLNFRFPNLHNSNIFTADFFDDQSEFWQSGETFDWIVGNPPWIELEPTNDDHRMAVEWVERSRGVFPVARYRSSEAFAWRVRNRLATGGVAGLISPASTLTNEHSRVFRQAFFRDNVVHRITNLSNLTYVSFVSAREPAATMIYSAAHHDGAVKPDIVHFGPLLVNQPATRGRSSKSHLWVLTVSESEVQAIPATEAEEGRAATWKRALWGTATDGRVLAALRRVFPSNLEKISDERGWTFALGVQLRGSRGAETDPNMSVAEFEMRRGVAEVTARAQEKWFGALTVLDPQQLKRDPSLEVVDRWLKPNTWGTFIRKVGGTKGLPLARAPHILLWNEFAAFSDTDFIFRHPDIGIASPAADADWLRAIAMVWSSSLTVYSLVLELSAKLGVGRSIISYGDAAQVPMPRLTDEQVGQLADCHRALTRRGTEWGMTQMSLDDYRRVIDAELAAILRVPPYILSAAREFTEYRLPLVHGRTPRELTRPPDAAQLNRYASRLKAELDEFVQRRALRHAVTVLHSAQGIVSTVELLEGSSGADAVVREASPGEVVQIRQILHDAEARDGQWFYIRRSVRVFAGRKVHLCKPPRTLEWTEASAVSDAADIIAEVAMSQG